MTAPSAPLPPGVLDLTLVRHGATDWNALGRWQGWTDSPLGAKGEGQAQRLSLRLEKQEFDHLYASDLARAARTAEMIRPGQSLILDVRLRELNFGKYEGASTDDVLSDPEFAEWQLDPWQKEAPGGGESLLQVAERLRDWAEGLPDGKILAVSHGAAIRALLHRLFEWPARPVPGYVLPFPNQLAHTALTRLQRQNGRWTLITFNDYAHLE